jgi:tRNA pseudouridine38-40 synthase
MKDNLLVFRITSNRFLRSMVRLVVGSLLEVGKGKISIEDFRKIIESKDRMKSGKAVAASGLYLVDVLYPDGILKVMH